MKQDTVRTDASKLAKRLREKMSKDAETIERVTQEELSKLGKSIANKSSESLSTTRTDIEKSITDLKTLTLKTWMQVGLSIGITVLVVAGGGLSFLSYESNRLASISAQKDLVKSEIETLNQTIAERQSVLSTLPEIKLTQDPQGNRYLWLTGWKAGKPIQTGTDTVYVPISPITPPQVPQTPTPSQDPTYK